MEKMTRRKFIAGTVAAAAAVGGGALLESKRESSTPKEKQEEPIGEEKENVEAFLEVEKHPKPVEMGALAKIKFSGLLSAYSIGEERAVRPVEEIDFRYQLAQLWRKKLNYVGLKSPDFYPRMVDVARTSFEAYDQSHATKMSLHEYRSHANAALKAVRAESTIEHITEVPAFKRLGKPQIELLKKLEQHINSNSLIAYELTELMPTKRGDAAVGVALLDVLLKNAGVEFIDNIPAVHDSRISKGPYQFTSDAIYELGHDFHGASRIQHAITKKRQIPTSVLTLRGEEQHKAAYLFALDNLAMAVLRLGEHRSQKLVEHMAELPQYFVAEYIASAHHLPVNARESFEGFTDELNKYLSLGVEQKKKAKKPDFLAYCSTHGLGEYCSKTRDNLEILGGKG